MERYAEEERRSQRPSQPAECSSYFCAGPYCLAAILLLAVLLRAVGLFYGLPYSYYFDEEHVVKRAVQMGSGDLNPHWFHKPALLYYLLFFEYGVYFVIGRLAGAFSSVEDFAVSFFLDTGPFYAIGRVTVCLLGVATVYLAYEVGRRLYDRRAGLLAASVLAVTAGHAALCQVVKEDVPAAFFSAVALLLLARFLEGGSTRALLLSGLAVGLGTATKYYPIALTVPAALSPWIRARALGERGGLRRAWVAPAAMLGGFFAGSPYNFLDSTWALETWRVRILPILGRSPYVADDATYRGQGLWLSARDFVATIVQPDAMGPLLGTLGLLALLFLAVRRRPADTLLVLGFVPFAALAIVANPSATEARHMNLVFVVLALASGAGGSALVERLRRPGSRRTSIGLAAAAALLLGVPAHAIHARNRTLTRVDPRTRARDWIEASIPGGTRVLLNTNELHLVDNEENLVALHREALAIRKPGPWTSHLADYYRLRAEAAKRYRGPKYDQLVFHEPWWQAREQAAGEVRFGENVTDVAMTNPLVARGVAPLEEYRERGFRYFVSVENLKNKYLVEPWRSRFPSFARFYDAVERELVVEKEFEDPKNPPPSGVRVRVYRF